MATQTLALSQSARPAPATTAGKGLKTLLVNKYGPAIKAALPAVMTPERFTRIALSALSGNPMLQQATPESFFGALLTAAQLGLEPNTPLGQAYLIGRNNRRLGVVEAQFQLGYKGLIALAYRSGQVSSIQAEVVCERDEFDYAFGLEPKLSHRPATGNRGAPTHYYAVWKTKDGASGFAVMGIEDVKAHAKKFSDAVKGGKMSPWDSNFDEMAKKTVLKKALKYAPLSSDFVRGLASDNAIREYRDGIDALDTASKTDENGEIIDLPVAQDASQSGSAAAE
jgi:recombination protein RecT